MELRCEHEHLQATVKEGVLYIACASCSHAARKSGQSTPVVHAFDLLDLIYNKESSDAEGNSRERRLVGATDAVPAPREALR